MLVKVAGLMLLLGLGPGVALADVCTVDRGHFVSVTTGCPPGSQVLFESPKEEATAPADDSVDLTPSTPATIGGQVAAAATGWGLLESLLSILASLVSVAGVVIGWRQRVGGKQACPRCSQR